MLPANDGTPNAIVNRVRVTPDIDAKGTGVADTPASGQPVNVVLSPDRRLAFVVNHSGSVTQEAAQKFQHGHPGTFTILSMARALDPANAGTLKAVEAVVPTGGFGPVGIAATADGKHAFVSNAEGEGLEDGGRTIAVIDLATRKVVGNVTQAYGKPGIRMPSQSDSARHAACEIRLLPRLERHSHRAEAGRSRCSPPTVAPTTCR